MTNRLSLLGKVNGGRRGVYGNCGELGGFRAKGGFRLRSAECGVRNWGKERPSECLSIAVRCFRLVERATADRAETRVSKKCVFAKRTQLKNGVLAMPDWLEPYFDIFKNEPKRTQIGHFQTQIWCFQTGNDEISAWLDQAIAPQPGADIAVRCHYLSEARWERVGKNRSDVGTVFRFYWGNGGWVGISRFFPGGEPLECGMVAEARQGRLTGWKICA